MFASHYTGIYANNKYNSLLPESLEESAGAGSRWSAFPCLPWTTEGCCSLSCVHGEMETQIKWKKLSFPLHNLSTVSTNHLFLLQYWGTQQFFFTDPGHNLYIWYGGLIRIYFNEECCCPARQQIRTTAYKTSVQHPSTFLSSSRKVLIQTSSPCTSLRKAGYCSHLSTL